MTKEQFKNYMRSAGLGEGTITSYVSDCKASEIYLCDELHMARDLDEIVSNDILMRDALDHLNNSNRKSAINKYYEYKNGHLSSQRTRQTAKKISTKKGYFSNFAAPMIIPGYGEDRFGAVKYDVNVLDDEKIEGLTGYLVGVLDSIVSSRGRFILNDNIQIFYDRNSWPFIPIVLKKELPYETFYESDEYIARKIANSDNNYKGILSILKNREKKDRIFGEYYHSGCPANLEFNLDKYFRFEDGSIPYIVLYYNNTNILDSEEYKIAIANCLAHEYFHFIHDVYAQNEFSKKSKEAEAVKEGLADFFAIVYSSSTNILCFALEKILRGKYNAWVERFGSGWPYAYAYYFYLINGRTLDWTPLDIEYEQFGSFEKFNYVFEESRVDIKEAFKILTR